jgi:hypothetical protein
MFAPDTKQLGIPATKFFKGGHDLRAVCAKGFAEVARGCPPFGGIAAFGLAFRGGQQNRNRR